MKVELPPEFMQTIQNAFHGEGRIWLEAFPSLLETARGWLAIDPKGVIGPRGYEVGPFLINPVPGFLNENKPLVQTERRISILSEMLDMERERIRAWGVCHAVLSAWWSIEDNEPGGCKYSLRCANIFSRLRV